MTTAALPSDTVCVTFLRIFVPQFSSSTGSTLCLHGQILPFTRWQFHTEGSSFQNEIIPRTTFCIFKI